MVSALTTIALDSILSVNIRNLKESFEKEIFNPISRFQMGNLCLSPILSISQQQMFYCLTLGLDIYTVERGNAKHACAQANFSKIGVV